MNPALITGKIVDTMRNDDATGQTGEIMIKRFERLLAVYLAITVERAQEFLLLGIDAQDGVAAARNSWMRWVRWRNWASRYGESPPGNTLAIWRRAKPSVSRMRRTMRGLA